MQEKKKLVAISLKQEQVFQVKSVGEKEYNELLNKQHECESKKDLKELQLNTKIDNMQTNIGKLLYRDILLAKSIYDNFVDRGLLDNDDKFQQMWFDFYFNSCELDLEKAPQEYTQILNKVGNL